MRFVWTIILSLSLAGCAATVAYNPMQVDTPQEILLNESGFKAIQDGMDVAQVHQIMGQELVIGYKLQAANYNPLTIANPYKTQTIPNTDYSIEYYIESIRQPDGVIHDNELMPLVFKNNKLIGRGWSLANSLIPAKPSA